MKNNNTGVSKVYLIFFKKTFSKNQKQSPPKSPPAITNEISLSSHEKILLELIPLRMIKHMNKTKRKARTGGRNLLSDFTLFVCLYPQK